jgi:hypothetical protein
MACHARSGARSGGCHRRRPHIGRLPSRQRKAGGNWVGIHKTSFVVWLAVASVHVLVYVWRLPALVSDRRTHGFAVRVALVAMVFVVGLWVADETALHDRFT